MEVVGFPRRPPKLTTLQRSGPFQCPTKTALGGEHKRKTRRCPEDRPDPLYLYSVVTGKTTGYRSGRLRTNVVRPKSLSGIKCGRPTRVQCHRDLDHRHSFQSEFSRCNGEVSSPLRSQPPFPTSSLFPFVPVKTKESFDSGRETGMWGG